MWPPSDSFVLLLLPEAQAERRGWSAAETKNHNLNHKSSKGLVHLLWKLIGVFYRSETKWDLTHSSWMAARDRRAWMRLNHGSKHLWEGRFSVSFKFGEVSIFSSSLRIGFSRVVIADFGLWSLCKGGLSGGCRKGTGFKIPVFFFPQLCYWLSLWPWAHQFFHWSKWELNCILCFFMSQIPFLQNEDHNT